VVTKREAAAMTIEETARAIDFVDMLSSVYGLR
jgi:hypothetical protein